MNRNWAWALLCGIGFCFGGVAYPVTGWNATTPEKVFFHGGNGRGHIQELNVNYQLYSSCKNDLEGYSEMLSGPEFFSYPSLRDDINTAMIARATTGEMGFEFMTGVVPADYAAEWATFLFLSDIDLNQRHPFDIHLNGAWLLTFHANEDGTLTVMENPGNAQVEYVLIRRDVNGDGIGALRLTVPADLLEKGEKARLQFVGHQKNANSWIMIFKATDVVARLEKSVASEAAFEIREREGKLYVDAPAHFSGQPVYLVSDGRRSPTRTLQPHGRCIKGFLPAAPSPKKLFPLSTVVQRSRWSLKMETGP